MEVHEILNSLSDAVVIFNNHKVIEYVNKSTSILYGFEQDELIGRKIDVLLPNLCFNGLDDFSVVQRKMKGAAGEVFGCHKNGKNIPIDISLSNISVGEENRVLAIIVDMTVHNDIITELRKSKALYSSIVENSRDVVFKINNEGRILYINHTAPGLKREFVLGRPLYDFLPDDDSRKEVRRVVELTFKEGIPNRYDVVYPSPLGEIHYVTMINPIIENEIVTGASLISRDQTEAVRLNRELIEKDLFIQRLHDYSLNGIYIFNVQEAKNTYFNSRYTEILGYSLEEINEMSPEEFLDCFHQDDKVLVQSHMNQLLNIKKDEVLEIVCRIKTKEGKWKWCLSRNTGFEFDENEGLISFMGSFVDVTDQKELENKLRYKNRELEGFVSIASHDLKSPINSVLRLLDFIHDDPAVKSSDGLLESVRMTKKAVGRMKHLVELLLEHSLIGIDHTISSLDVKNVLDEVCRDLSLRIDLTGTEVEYSDMPVIFANAVELRQLFQNLLSNAIKFNNDQPKITIRFEDQLQHWLFVVEDNGIGIPEVALNKIFKLFERQHTQSDYEGAGIGLSNCLKIVNTHKGDIWAKSKEGVGSQFYFTISKNLNKTHLTNNENKYVYQKN